MAVRPHGAARPGPRGLPLLWLTAGAPGDAELRTAFAELGAPLDVLDLDEPHVRRFCFTDLSLARRDLHAA